MAAKHGGNDTAVYQMVMVAIILLMCLLCTPSSCSAYQSRTLTRKAGQHQQPLDAVIGTDVSGSDDDSTSAGTSEHSDQTASGNVESTQIPSTPKNISLFYPSECPTSNRSVYTRHYHHNHHLFVPASTSMPNANPNLMSYE
jgi:hypothetical protein